MATRRQVLALTPAVAAAACSGSSGEPDQSPKPSPHASKGMAIPSYQLAAMDDQELGRTMALLADLGCLWLRFDFFWADLEPRPGAFDWTLPERIVSTALPHGLRLLGVLHTMPAWCRPPGTKLVHGPDTDERRRACANFAAAAAVQFRGRIHAWELWNEPNLVAFWAPRPGATDYLALVAALAPAIRSADRDALLLTGGLGGPTRPGELDPLAFLTQLLDAGLGRTCDAIGLHPYTNLTGKIDGGLLQALEVNALLVARGLGDLGVWGTETGAPTRATGGRAMTPAAQAELVTHSYDFWRTRVRDAGPLFWYCLQDSGTTTRDQSFGLVNANGNPKPALTSYQTIPR